MGKSEAILIAIGGGEFAEAEEIVDAFIDLVKQRPDPRITVMTVATLKPKGAIAKYNNLFRGHGIKHVESVDVSVREDSFSKAATEKILRADALFFSGGDQLNVTSLIGGSRIEDAVREMIDRGGLIAGTSAGAAMMSKWMIISGDSDLPPSVGSVEIGPGMDLLNGMIIDTHFSQRGRHGRLLTAIAHYPQALGVGIDERTAIKIQGNKFEVLGEGGVTVFDGSQMRLNDLPYKKEDEMIGISGVIVHVMPKGYSYDIKERTVNGPTLRKLVGTAEGASG